MPPVQSGQSHPCRLRIHPAFPLARRAQPPDAMAALEATADAESQLAIQCGKTGDRSKIEPEKVAEIEKLLKSGKSYGEVAKITGLSKGTIFKRGKVIPNLGKWKADQAEK